MQVFTEPPVWLECLLSSFVLPGFQRLPAAYLPSGPGSHCQWGFTDPAASPWEVQSFPPCSGAGATCIWIWNAPSFIQDTRDHSSPLHCSHFPRQYYLLPREINTDETWSTMNTLWLLHFPIVIMGTSTEPLGMTHRPDGLLWDCSCSPGQGSHALGSPWEAEATCTSAKPFIVLGKAPNRGCVKGSSLEVTETSSPQYQLLVLQRSISHLLGNTTSAFFRQWHFPVVKQVWKKAGFHWEIYNIGTLHNRKVFNV